MSMLLGDVGDQQAEHDKSVKESTDRMQALQEFASISARVPDAKHSKSRQKKIIDNLESKLKNEGRELQHQICEAERTIEEQKRQISELIERLK